MKINRIKICSLAAAAICACQAEDVNEGVHEVSEYKVSFIANTEAEPQTPASKANVGINASGKMRTFWEDGDRISVYSEGNNSSNAVSNSVLYAFETSLNSPSSSAVFGYTGDDFVLGEHYIALYPHTDGSSRAANFQYTRMAQVDVPAEQKLVADGFDRRAAVMMAYSDNLSELNFKNAVALVRFRVADADVTSGRFSATGAKIAGRFRGDIKLSDDGIYSTELVEYSSGSTNAPTSTLSLSADGGGPLAVGKDYYVAVRPVALENGFSVYLNDTFVKTYYITEFKRNTIYNLGTLTVPEAGEIKEQMTLEFDFTTDENFVEGPDLNAWPRKDTSTGSTGGGIDVECLYDLNGTQYSFRLVESPNAVNSRIYWNSGGYITLANTGRYIGLPVIDGYKLVKVDCLHATSASSNGRGLSISSDVGATTTTSGTIVNGGEQKITKDTKDHLVYVLSNTMPGVRYYLYCSKSGIGLSNITLVYEKDSSTAQNTVRIGTYNLRYINSSETNEANLWENRKDRLIQSIIDNDFDVFAVQECSGGIKSYLETELASTYSGNYFNPYAGHTSKDESIGILYKKDAFSLSDWRTFYLADDISKVNSISAPNDASGDYTYYRGGCCAVVTRKATSEKFFVISTHGCLGAEYRARYASIYETVEKKYNTSGYPAFLIGDMNSRPTDDASVEYRTYWDDVYRSIRPEKISGPFATYNGFDLDRDLNADPKRLDYIYYRGATPLKYVCNNRKYDGLYASDHLPVYADMLLSAE